MSFHGTVITSRDGDTLVATDRPAAIWVIGGVLVLAGLVLAGAMAHGFVQGAAGLTQLARGVGAALTIAAGTFLVAHAPLTRFILPRRGRTLSVRRFWLRGPESMLLERYEVDTIAVEEQLGSEGGQRWYWLGIRLRSGHVVRMTAQGLPVSHVQAMELVAAELRGWWSLPQPVALPPLGEHVGMVVPASARVQRGDAEPTATPVSVRPPSPTPAAARLRLIG